MSSAYDLAVLETVATGLCATCAEAPRCTHPRLPGVPVAWCDDATALEIDVPSAVGVAAAVARPTLVRTAPKGLCGTCVRFSNCTYPKPESGVWRCEEFE